jgi:hypothetical protein
MTDTKKPRVLFVTEKAGSCLTVAPPIYIYEACQRKTGGWQVPFVEMSALVECQKKLNAANELIGELKKLAIENDPCLSYAIYGKIKKYEEMK